MATTVRFVTLAVLVAILLQSPGLAQRTDDDDPEFHFDGEVRVRGEYLSNLLDAQDSGDDPALDDDLLFYPYLARLGVHGDFPHGVWGLIEIQGAGFFGDTPPRSTPSDPFGQSEAAFDDGSADIKLYQAFIELDEINDSNWYLALGRREHAVGNELNIGDDDFYNGISFDGVRAFGDLSAGTVDLFYYLAAESDIGRVQGSLYGGFFGPTPPVVNDGDVSFSGATFRHRLTRTNQHIEPYFLYLRDDDPRPGNAGVKVFTLGARYGREIRNNEEIDDNPMDWNVEVAFQTGDLEGGDASLRGNIIEGWFAYNWAHGTKARSRVHVGLLRASGDDDPTDDVAGAFVPMFPDPHAHNRLGDLDAFGGTNAISVLTFDPQTRRLGMTNVTDINAGYAWSGKGGIHRARAAVHHLSVTESDQPGPALFSVSGDPRFMTLSDGNLGLEVDASYRYAYSFHLEIEAGVAWLFPGNLLDQTSQIIYGNDADDIARVWGQLRLTW